MEWNELSNTSKILQILKEKDNNLFSKIKDIRKVVKPILEKTNVIFPEYTLHNIDHSDEVVRNFDIIIPESLMHAMNKWELFFLVVSAYLHDIGMAFDVNIDKYNIDKENFEKVKRKLENEGKNIDEIKREFIRKFHHLRSEEYIEKHWKDLKLDNPQQAYFIGRICRGHRDVELNYDDYPSESVYDSFTINLPLLTMFLRIADELDIRFVRAPLIVFETLGIKNPKSREEWKKHLSVSGVSRSNEDPLKIIVDVPKCDNPMIHRNLKRWETKVQKMLWELPKYLYRYRDFVGEIPTRIFVQIRPEGYEVVDIKFRLNEKLVLTLLKNYVYSKDDFSIVIRELLQNSVDACRRLLEELRRMGIQVKPNSFEIVFELKNEENKIVLLVEDNGFGMNEFIIKNYLGHVGESFYQSEEFKSEGYEFSPVSRFGLGLLSYFLIADKVEIETKAEGETDGWFISIDSIFDYFFVKRIKKDKIGTKIKLYLKDNVVMHEKPSTNIFREGYIFAEPAIIINPNIEGVDNEVLKNYMLEHYQPVDINKHSSYILEVLYRNIEYWVNHVEFPIRVKFQNLERIIEPIDFEKRLRIWWDEHFSTILSNKDKNIYEYYEKILNKTKNKFGDIFYIININNDYMRGIFAIPLWNLYDKIPDTRGHDIIISVGGIRIPNGGELVHDIYMFIKKILSLKFLGYICLDLNPRYVNLDISRDNIISYDPMLLYTFKREIVEKIKKLVNVCLKENINILKIFTYSFIKSYFPEI